MQDFFLPYGYFPTVSLNANAKEELKKKGKGKTKTKTKQTTTKKPNNKQDNRVSGRET